VTADADGQHAPFDILKLVEESNKIPDHLVLGYRTFEKEVPFRSRLGNNISKIVYRCLLGLNFKDTQTGLRAIPRALAIETLKIKANKYELETEQLIIAARNKIPISQVPIKTIYEEGNASSHFNPIFDSIRIYYSLFRYFIASIITAITDFVAYLIISRFADIVLSNLLSRYVALFVQYTLIKKFVFKSEGSISKLIIFIGIVSLTGLISGVLQKELIGSTGMSLVVSKIIVDSGLFIFNFLFLRDILFGKEDID
jgi:putative flippase GtrA